jgi:prophage tail gpP-like protein
MSGLVAGALSALGWDDLARDDVSIVIGSTQLAGWQSVNIVRSCEAFPNSFALTATEEYPYDASRIIAEPGKGVCKVYIGGDLLITGYVDRYAISTRPGAHDVMITGRGLCEDLVDCSADLINSPDTIGGMINASDALDLATKLAKPFGITVKLVGDDKGKSIPLFQVALGETPYEIIERVARYAGFLVYEDEAGNVVLDRVGTTKMASGFSMPGNIETASSMMSLDQRFSDYTVVWMSVNQYADVSNKGFQRAHVVDEHMPRYRPKIIVSEQTTPDFEVGEARANWELARRIGRSQAIELSCDAWRDSDGKLWQPNRLAPIAAAAHKIGGVKWIIGTAVFRKDQSGTHADLTLMPPDAYKPQPEPLQLWDREITQTPPSSQDPKPADTSTPPAAPVSPQVDTELPPGFR